ncbi:lipid A export permease/ATP-binding protein MsbA [Dechloromonas denitrificans]|uniref:Lipid A export permease/ATP-binding protein MsbA n=1 Tax=Dechloromonas denitrificans TaxID=281362 RepID=A0A133XKQ0_9RHOO|nr:lipid A export permease/ATP-binding protein MsbA [Dechloromonas denitrificans]KXB31525.1 lipid A export permease/ATP-binding protein MsbA [Dechloromonas denitrificans]
MASDMTSRELYLRLLTYVRPYWKVFAAALAAMGLSSLAEPVFPAMMKKLLDDGFSTAAGPWDWLLYPLAIMGIFLVRAIFGFVGEYSMSWVSNNVITELRQAMFARMVRLPTRYYSDNLSGRLMSRIAYDVTGVAGAATNALTSLIKDSLAIVGLMAWLLYLNWQLTLITLSVVPFIAVVVRTFSKRLRGVAKGQQESMGKITQVLQETIEGHKVVKIFGGQTYEEARFYKSVREQRRLAMRATMATSAQSPIVQFFAASGVAIIMGVALKQAAGDQTTVGSFVSFITAMLMILPPLRRITDVNAPIQRGLAAAESVFSLIDEAAEEDKGQEDLGRAQGLVEFDNVSFTYPGADRPALAGVSLTIRPGESVALVGPSGSGKTTAANLLPRFYAIDGGEIRVDGHALPNIKLNSLRDNIALVSQDVVLFNDTIGANIAYGGKSTATAEEIRAAAKAAHALEFIDALPEGFDTMIGENGVKLSGGQRQRLAIARAILKDAPILILDEATSALDTESERHVQAALDELMRGRSTLVIAHRLSTVERADRIVALAHGHKQEEGSHAELLAHDGLYARLYRMQKAEEAAA